MQSLFNKKKRKTFDDDRQGSDRSLKHSKSDSKEPESVSISQSRSFEISYKNSSSNVLTRSQAVANLLQSLEDILSEDGMDETITLIGDEGFNRCVDLRTSLSSHGGLVGTKKQIPTPSIKSRNSMSQDFLNFPKLISPLSVTPWKSSTIPTSLPPLPAVLDPTLAAAAFIHASIGSGRVTDLSYERLEWVGDIYLELIATLLIAQTFPSVGPGKLSQYRERLVKNVTLAEYSKQYGFDKRVRLPDHFFTEGPSKIKDSDLIKIYGDIFEAYVAAVILSDPVDGVRRASDWLKDLWGRTMQKDIIQEERNNFKMDSPMWRLRGDVGQAEDISAVDNNQIVPLNAKDELRKAIGSKGVVLRYEDIGEPKKDPKNKLPLFTVGVYLDGWEEKGKLLGTGKANGKKQAGLKAASMAIQNKKLLGGYIAKKKLFDEQMKRQQEAEEQAG